MNKHFKHSGRFSVDFETNRIHEALTSYQSEVGDIILYYKFARGSSETNDIYDEGTGVGRVFTGPINLPVLHVNRVEGPAENRAEGFYYNDFVHVTAVYDQVRRSGLFDLADTSQNYLHDRFVYDNRVFRILRINVTGQVQGRDIMVGIDGTEVKADEMVNDYQFAKWVNTVAGYPWGPRTIGEVGVPWSSSFIHK